jgi:Xaa-Pro aminopeptidase
LGIEVVSSGDLLQKQTCVWDEGKWQSHLEAAEALDAIIAATWREIGRRLKGGEAWTEYDVHLFMRRRLEEHGCFASEGPICAVNAHSADPHYLPEKQGAAVIKPGDFILLDIWGKRNRPRSVYADITRVGVAAAKPSETQQQIFGIVKAARDEATLFVQECFAKKREVRGYEIDRVCRKVIQDAGYGEFFTHRTGHNIDERDHGPGAHIDSLETHDERKILPGTCFSIEPGIYLPGEFGVRLEYDVFIHRDGKVQVTGGIQTELMTMSG